MLPSELAELVSRIRKQKSGGQTIEITSVHQDVPKRLYDTLSSFRIRIREASLFSVLMHLKTMHWPASATHRICRKK